MRIGASLLLAPIVSNTWLSALALHIAVRAKSFGQCVFRGLVSNGGLLGIALRILEGEGLWVAWGAAPRIANFRNQLSHASHASHTSHLQLASREAPRFAKRFSGSIQSAKPLDGRKNVPALNRRDGLLAARRFPRSI